MCVCVRGEVTLVAIIYITNFRSQSSESTDELCPVAYFEPNKDR